MFGSVMAHIETEYTNTVQNSKEFKTINKSENNCNSSDFLVLLVHTLSPD
jgi:hypothetical protein